MAITGKKISELDEASVNAFKDILGIGEKIIDVTYDELVALMDPSDERLVPGQFYRITDFATVHWMVDCNNNYILDDTDGEKVIHTGTTEPLIVFATSENTLSPFAYSETHPEDIIRYDWNVTNWESKKMFYDTGDIVTGFKGIITRREDTVNVLCTNFDFREITYRIYSIAQEAWAIGTSYIKDEFVQNANFIYIALAPSTGVQPGVTAGWMTYWKKIATVDESVYQSFSSVALHSEYGYAIPILDTEDYEEKTMFGTGCYNIVFEECKNIPFCVFGDGCYMISLGVGTQSILFGAGCLDMTIGAGSFDINFGADCFCITTSNESCSLFIGYYTMDIIVAPYVWKVFIDQYCFDVQIGTLVSEVSIGYYCAGIVLNTESNAISIGEECYFLNFDVRAEDIIIGDGSFVLQFGIAADTITLGDACEEIEIGMNCRSITLGAGCKDIKFGSSCGYSGAITIADNCYNIEFGNGCEKITIAESSYNVKIGQGSSHIELGDSSGGVNNIDIGQGCGGEGQGIVIEGLCKYITFGNGCRGITIATEAETLSFGNNCGYTSDPINIGYLCCGISFGNGCSNIDIGQESSNISMGNMCEDIHIGSWARSLSFEDGCIYITLPERAWYNTFLSSCDVLKDFTDSSVVQLNDIHITHRRVGTKIVGTYLEEQSDGSFVEVHAEDIIGVSV